MGFKQVQAKVGTGRIALVQEAPNAEEAIAGELGRGNDYDLLRRVLSRAGIDYNSIFHTVVVSEYPPNGDISRLSTAVLDAAALRLKEEIDKFDPYVVVAAGSTALWALTGLKGINTYRGTVLPAKHKVIATYGLDDTFRNWNFLPVVMADFAKANRESEYREIRRKKRMILVAENAQDLEDFYAKYHVSNSYVAFDIETEATPPRITSYSIATSDAIALVVNVDILGERLAIPYLERWIDCIWIGHNILYDLTWVALYGIKPPRCEDTMLMHHSWQLELKKGLGFVGSLHANEMAWKELRVKAKSKINKGDE